MRGRQKNDKDLFLILIFCAFVGFINCKSGLDICDREPIHTTSPRTPGDGDFWIKIHGLPVGEKYRAEQTYTVEINGESKFLGFMLVVVQQGQKDERKATFGEFQIPPLGRVEHAQYCDHAVLKHRYLMAKPGVNVRWTAPKHGSGCLEFRATVIKSPHNWYKDEGQLTTQVCEDETQGDAVPVEPMDPAACCSCRHAMYKVVFQGLWSRQTHPKGFPTDDIDIEELSWSAIVGASHSVSYNLWQYGSYASQGVKDVCENGITTSVEKDMKQHSRKIRTVLKTNPISSTHGSTHAVLSVNPSQHLLSLLSMFGPSPDWCVGVSSLDLCDKSTCTWVDKKEIDLYPWDAGTDSGTSYFTRPMQSDPQQKIHRISNRYPNDPDSPFYGPDPVKPMAKLVISKTKEECDVPESLTVEKEPQSPSTEELVAKMKKQLMVKKRIEMEKCATEDWSKWSSCSSDCGVGEKVRRRVLKNSDIRPSMCSLDFVEKEPCVGDCGESKKKYSSEYDFNSIKDYNYAATKKHCQVTPFSDWSDCSVTCGLGIRERWRMFLTKMPKNNDCGLHLMEKEVCVGKLRTCPATNITDRCMLPLDKGPCTGEYIRYHYDTLLGRCLAFKYGGCNGNGNNFITFKQCHLTCVTRYYMRQKQNDFRFNQMDSYALNRDQYPSDRSGQSASLKIETEEDILTEKKRKRYMRRLNKERKYRRKMKRNDRISCKVSPWAEWSSCSVTCGKGLQTRTRSIIVHPSNGKKCPRKLLRKKRCKLPKCPIDCVVSEWTAWTPCSRTCGENAVQVRKRKVTQRSKRGGKSCPAKRNKRFCNLPMCSEPEINLLDALMRSDDRYNQP